MDQAAADRNASIIADFGETLDRSDIVMGFNIYQQKAMETAIYKDLVIYPALQVASEGGEVAGKVAKCLRDNNGDFNDERKAEIAKEIGDTFWNCAALCRDLGLNFGEVALGNIDKLASRKARGVLGGSGDNR